MFSLIYAWINGWVNNREAGDLRRYRAQYDVTVMIKTAFTSQCCRHRCLLQQQPSLLSQTTKSKSLRLLFFDGGSLCQKRNNHHQQGLYSLSGGRLAAISHEVTKPQNSCLDFSNHWYLAGTSAEALPRCLSNFRAIRSWHQQAITSINICLLLS